MRVLCLWLVGWLVGWFSAAGNISTTSLSEGGGGDDAARGGATRGRLGSDGSDENGDPEAEEAEEVALEEEARNRRIAASANTLSAGMPVEVRMRGRVVEVMRERLLATAGARSVVRRGAM